MGITTKYLLSMCLLIVFSEATHPQSIFYDAMYLKRFTRIVGGKYYLSVPTDNDTVANILWAYIPDSAKKIDNGKFKYKVLQKYFDNVGGGGNDNPFIELPGEQKTEQQFSFSNMSKVLSSAGGLDVTNIADGFAKFLVKRTKEELNIAFFDKLKKQFGYYPEFRIFFPNAYNVLNTIESYEYASMLQTMKEAFETDIRLLPVNLAQIRNLDTTYCIGSHGSSLNDCKTRMEAIKNFFDTDSGKYIKVGLVLVENIASGYNTADVIHNVAQSEELNQLRTNFKNSVLLADFISQSLRSKDQNKVWVSSYEMNELFNERAGIDLYLGLLYQLPQSRQIVFDKPGAQKSFQDILGDIHNVSNQIDSLKQKLMFFANLSDNVNSASKRIQKYNEDATNPDFMAYYNYFTSASNAIRQLTQLPRIKDYPEARKVQDVLDIFDPAVEMTYNISTKNYSAAILNLTIFTEKSRIIPDVKLQKQVLKYGTFISTVATAQNSDDVEKAIEAVALPAGSSSIKRNTVSNIALNSYVGVFLGTEGLKYNDKFNYRWNLNLTAPVGVAFSWGNNDRSALSLYLGIFDLGSVVNFRFNDDTTKTLPAFKLQNIVAPSASILYGFADSPFSLGIMAQYGPELRKLSATNAEFETSAWRIGLALTVDIPLLNFYTNPR